MVAAGLDQTLNVFRAIGEETRLRIMALLTRGELTVTELTQVLGQSQPRVSRHVKILADAHLVERYREGAWVFYRLNDGTPALETVRQPVETLMQADDLALARDVERLKQVHAARAELAATYFQENADSWDELRRLHLPESDIEATMRDMIGDRPVEHFLDLGTGTGRMLIVFQDLYERATGYDLSKEMLSVARAELEEANVTHAQIRMGDLFSLPQEKSTADVVCLHQVLHFLSDPATAIAKARAFLKPGGRLLVTDFASHELEFLRDSHAHRRLGFSDDEVKGWARKTGLQIARTETLNPGRGEAGKLTVKVWLLVDGQNKPVRKARSKVTQHV
jgi:ArsR family transcriptional regulator